MVWLYRKLAGMNTDPEFPGYRHVIFKPQPAGDISMAAYSNLTPYGNCSVKWEKKDGKFMMNIEVPVGSNATVYVPSDNPKNITEGGKKIRRKSGFTFRGMKNGYAVYNVVAGNYKLDCGAGRLAR